VQTRVARDMTKNGVRPVHPSEILREDFLAVMGMSANALAKALHVPAPRVNDIVRERSGVTADTALLHTCSVFEVELAAE
jgi:antitoxin HigA-1